MGIGLGERIRIPKPTTKQPKPNTDETDTLRALCVVLQALAQKYLPEHAFADRASLVQCLRLMSDLDINVTVQAQYVANCYDNLTDKNTLAYRLLKNKTIAALSTIADLDKKTLDRPPTEYQNGMYAAYKKASDIAMTFLVDIQGEVGDRYACAD